ncbi:MAG: cbb3-type cytochrome oxidase assembly protein CcoS [Pseudomonadota bacterium]|jgi:cbb3-type cytochrome oxidase maturation protein
MTILYLLIPLSLILLGLAVWAFFWAVKHDQFDDLEGPAHRILFDEDENDLAPEERQRRQQAREQKSANRKSPNDSEQP